MKKPKPFPCEHWSASRFLCWEQCPAEFYARYIAGAKQEPTEAMLFGSAVHQGLEAHFKGGAAEPAFRAAWKSAADSLGQVDPKLSSVGLDLLDRVVELDLQHGTTVVSEWAFSIDTTERWGAPLVGAVDLIDLGDGHIYDFKTTTGAWSQARAERDIWQPALYALAVSDALDWPDQFTYVVLNKPRRSVALFHVDHLIERWLAMEKLADTIVQRVRDGDFACHGKHGFCQECGARWDHGHVCDLSTAPPRIRL
jgi:RecB family exonuclease